MLMGLWAALTVCLRFAGVIGCFPCCSVSDWACGFTADQGPRTHLKAFGSSACQAKARDAKTYIDVHPKPNLTTGADPVPQG